MGEEVVAYSGEMATKKDAPIKGEPVRAKSADKAKVRAAFEKVKKRDAELLRRLAK